MNDIWSDFCFTVSTCGWLSGEDYRSKHEQEKDCAAVLFEILLLFCVDIILIAVDYPLRWHIITDNAPVKTTEDAGFLACSKTVERAFSKTEGPIHVFFPILATVGRLSSQTHVMGPCFVTFVVCCFAPAICVPPFSLYVTIQFSNVSLVSPALNCFHLCLISNEQAIDIVLSSLIKALTSDRFNIPKLFFYLDLLNLSSVIRITVARSDISILLR